MAQVNYVHQEESKNAVLDLFAKQNEANRDHFTDDMFAAVQAAVAALPDYTRPKDKNGADVDEGYRIHVALIGQVDKDYPQRSVVNVTARYEKVSTAA